MMTGSWWLIWMLFMFVFLVAPLGYGWGYRSWGAPYPRYIQKRRGAQAVARTGSPSFNHQSWGWAGDYVWIIFIGGVFWATAAFWWH